MDIRKYNTDQLTFQVNKVNTPGNPTYQLVVKYSSEWIFEDFFDTEEEAEAFVQLHYEIFKFRAEVIDWKLEVYKTSMCRETREYLEGRFL